MRTLMLIGIKYPVLRGSFAQFMNFAGGHLGGTYWHLATRPEELRKTHRS